MILNTSLMIASASILLKINVVIIRSYVIKSYMPLLSKVIRNISHKSSH